MQPSEAGPTGANAARQTTMKTENNIEPPTVRAKKVYLFGHFGTQNFGNESTLEVVLHHLHQCWPGARAVCICTNPEATAAAYQIEAIPFRKVVVKPWKIRNRTANLIRKLVIGMPNELHRWWDAFNILKGADLFIVPGTGLLTDTFGLLAWGPYNLFKWTLMARLRGCRVLFVSVGAGPINTTSGRCLVRWALSQADFRSYRDQASRDYLAGIGFSVNGDRIYPDLVFGLPAAMSPTVGRVRGHKPVVGLGLMEYAGAYSVEAANGAQPRPYLGSMVEFAGWLLRHDYDIRLLVGDSGDILVVDEFKKLLKARMGGYDRQRIMEMSLGSVQNLLSQLEATDLVVATRFHNILLALVLNKPVIAVSFHHKCASLMEDMGLAKYCHDINHMNVQCLTEQFHDLEQNAEKLRLVIKQKAKAFREALDEQYRIIFKNA